MHMHVDDQVLKQRIKFLIDEGELYVAKPRVSRRLVIALAGIGYSLQAIVIAAECYARGIVPW